MFVLYYYLAKLGIVILDSFTSDDSTQEILDFRATLERHLIADNRSEVVQFIGGAIGLNYGYVDFITYDIEPVLDAALEFFAKSEVKKAYFKAFRSDVAFATLKSTEQEQKDKEPIPSTDAIAYEVKAADDAATMDSHGIIATSNQAEAVTSTSDDTLAVGLNDYDVEGDDPKSHEQEQSLEPCLVYEHDKADEFYAKTYELREDAQYTASIKALKSVPNEYRDLKHAIALSRTLEDYALNGDNHDGCPNYMADCALLEAVELLNEFEDEGKDSPDFNKSMAIAYHQLKGGVIQSVKYAEKWKELDPDDLYAASLVEICKNEIAHIALDLGDDKDAVQRRKNQAAAPIVIGNSGTFLGNVLLSSPEFDKELLLKTLKSEWDIEDDKDDDGVASQGELISEAFSNDIFVIRQGKMFAAISLMQVPVPNGEAPIRAQNNYYWPGAVKAAQEHQAHILVAVLGPEVSVRERGMLFTKVVASCCRLPNASGVLVNRVVMAPDFYADVAQVINEGDYPINNWIWIGLFQNQRGITAYSIGMEMFGKQEIEIVDVDADVDPADLRHFLYLIVKYVITKDVTLHEGETLYLTASEKFTISISDGVVYRGKQTIKVPYIPVDVALQAEKEKRDRLSDD